jgi:ABC-type lipoprotein export system ATPase subunit
MNNLKGSEWRKWDLHVHSPASYGFKGTYDQVVNQILTSEADIIGINDYFTIEGYKEVKSRLPTGTNKTILPVVEMRMHNVLANRHKNNSGVRINFHIIFNPYDNDRKKDLIPSIESFVKSIKYKEVSGKNAIISDIYSDKSALLNKVAVDYNDVIDELDKSDVLLGNYLVWLPYDEYGGVGDVQSTNFPFKPALINRAHIIGSSNNAEINYFFGEREDYYNYFKRAKPCIKGSDSHAYNYPIGKLRDAGSNPIDKYCWIKADPTFDGLKQIVREPKYRVYIGEMPLKLQLVAKNKTKYIQSVSIKKIGNSTHQDIWFNNNIEFNSGLVAIIGNKGKGKSALAEILGILGNSYNYAYFSFLTNDKFKKNKLASNFESKIKWLADKDESSLSLMAVPDKLKVERIKCIPQNYLEILCNNLDKKFQEEIDSVIFSHIDDSERIEKTSLNELILYKTQIIDDKISKHQNSIVKINKQIIGLEDQLKTEYSKQLEDKLEILVKELKSHCGIIPKKVAQPRGDKAVEGKHRELQNKLSKLNKDIMKNEKDIKEKKHQLLKVNEDIEKLKIIKGKIEAFGINYNDLESDLRDELKALMDVKLSDLVALKIDYKKIDGKLFVLGKEKKDLINILNVNYVQMKASYKDNSYDNLYKTLKKKQLLRKQLQEQVDEPFKKHQDYLEKLDDWKQTFLSKNNEKRKLKADLEKVKSEIPSLLEKAKHRREELIDTLFALLKDKVKVYEDLYKPVINFILQERNKNKYMELNFSAEIMFSPDFDEKFLSYIDRGKKGSFQGIKESQELLKEIKQKYNFLESKEVISFVNEIIYNLHSEIISDDVVDRVLENQLVQGKSKKSLYSYLYLLKFLKIDYRLKWGNKLLEELSPGERGAVLLIFYLLIDKDDIPLIIDQPEENLDNESIYYLLVRYIKEAKGFRQIFIVTHNPNLAVVCDAEQIIYCDLDKRNRYKVSYNMGSIENIEIKKKIINILEGTPPAFTNRRDKYEI